MQASHLYDLNPGSGLPLSLLTGTHKEQRAQERQETAHRNPTVKHSPTTVLFCSPLSLERWSEGQTSNARGLHGQHTAWLHCSLAYINTSTWTNPEAWDFAGHMFCYPKDRIWETTGEPPHVPASLSLCPPLSMSTDFLWVLASLLDQLCGKGPRARWWEGVGANWQRGWKPKSCTNILELSVCESK